MSNSKMDEAKALKKRNFEIKRRLNREELPTNVRDELLNELEENTFLINEILTELKDPKIVPVTGTHTVSEHVYSKRHAFSESSYKF